MVTDLSVVCPGRLVTGKASCMIWKYEKKKKNVVIVSDIRQLLCK